MRMIMGLWIFVFLSCNNESESNIREVKEFYRGGQLKSLAKMKNDSIFVDTLTIFWENGHLKEKRVYDSSGVLNGHSYLYDTLGRKNYEIFIKNGSPYGYSFEFYPNGQVKSKVFRIGSKQVGNTYHFDTKGDVDTFSFFDFSNQIIIEKNYSDGKLIRQRYKGYFIDTILPTSDREKINLGIVLAKPPYELVNLKIFKVDLKENVYDSTIYKSKNDYDSVSISLDEKLKLIRLKCIRYDSILHQTTLEEGEILVGESH